MNFFSTLANYCNRTFLKSFLITLICLALIVAFFDFSEIQRRAAIRPDILLGLKLKLVLLKLFYILEQVLPFIVFISSLFIFWKLNRQNEVVVTRAAGVSALKLVLPVVIAALSVGFLDIGVINPISSVMMQKHEKLEDKYFHQKENSLKVSENGLWLRERHHDRQWVYRMGKADLPQKMFSDVTVYGFLENNEFMERYDAKSARLLDNHQLLLEDVWKLEKGKAPQKLTSLQIDTTLSQDSIENVGVHRAVLSFWQLPGYIHLLKVSGLSALKYEMYWHSTLARGFWLGAMILLAAAFSFRPIRSGGSVILAIAGLMSGFILYFIRDFTYALGTSGVVPAILAAWLPCILTAVMGLALLLHLEDG
ncbi:LPS export ABC transporter permease LptG [Candidatus Bealeia paramacronuclearis]|uniref:LPS export ABC transporter permease LptG n=1 Tax=Candidatus Bealeia paramacronuclearis TaxID=1921001 RepID=A0ABZ2C3B9_9PROT|nr:LPS export ABC transporter permease LptG [Candidatus Bealeia paramacronuclearis]